MSDDSVVSAAHLRAGVGAAIPLAVIASGTEVKLAGAGVAAREVGINGAANGFGLVLFVLPSLLLGTPWCSMLLSFVFADASEVGGGTSSFRITRIALTGVVLALLVVLAVVGAGTAVAIGVMTPSDYPDPPVPARDAK